MQCKRKLGYAVTFRARAAAERIAIARNTQSRRERPGRHLVVTIRTSAMSSGEVRPELSGQAKVTRITGHRAGLEGKLKDVLVIDGAFSDPCRSRNRNAARSAPRKSGWAQEGPKRSQYAE